MYRELRVHAGAVLDALDSTDQLALGYRNRRAYVALASHGEVASGLTVRAAHSGPELVLPTPWGTTWVFDGRPYRPSGAAGVSPRAYQREQVAWQVGTWLIRPDRSEPSAWDRFLALVVWGVASSRGPLARSRTGTSLYRFSYRFAVGRLANGAWTDTIDVLTRRAAGEREHYLGAYPSRPDAPLGPAFTDDAYRGIQVETPFGQGAASLRAEATSKHPVAAFTTALRNVVGVEPGDIRLNGVRATAWLSLHVKGYRELGPLAARAVAAVHSWSSVREPDLATVVIDFGSEEIPGWAKHPLPMDARPGRLGEVHRVDAQLGNMPTSTQGPLVAVRDGLAWYHISIGADASGALLTDESGAGRGVAIDGDRGLLLATGPELTAKHAEVTGSVLQAEPSARNTWRAAGLWFGKGLVVAGAVLVGAAALGTGAGEARADPRHVPPAVAEHGGGWVTVEVLVGAAVLLAGAVTIVAWRRVLGWAITALSGGRTTRAPVGRRWLARLGAVVAAAGALVIGSGAPVSAGSRPVVDQPGTAGQHPGITQVALTPPHAGDPDRARLAERVNEGMSRVDELGRSFDALDTRSLYLQAVELAADAYEFSDDADSERISEAADRIAERVFDELEVEVNPDHFRDRGRSLLELIADPGRDLINFEPGTKDETTGTPDEVNGRFSELGWAKGFDVTGSLTRTLTWNVGERHAAISTGAGPESDPGGEDRLDGLHNAQTSLLSGLREKLGVAAMVLWGAAIWIGTALARLVLSRRFHASLGGPDSSWVAAAAIRAWLTLGIGLVALPLTARYVFSVPLEWALGAGAVASATFFILAKRLGRVFDRLGATTSRWLLSRQMLTAHESTRSREKATWRGVAARVSIVVAVAIEQIAAAGLWAIVGFIASTVDQLAGLAAAAGGVVLAGIGWALSTVPGRWLRKTAEGWSARGSPTPVKALLDRIARVIHWSTHTSLGKAALRTITWAGLGLIIGAALEFVVSTKVTIESWVGPLALAEHGGGSTAVGAVTIVLAWRHQFARLGRVLGRFLLVVGVAVVVWLGAPGAELQDKHPRRGPSQVAEAKDELDQLGIDARNAVARLAG